MKQNTDRQLDNVFCDREYIDKCSGTLPYNLRPELNALILNIRKDDVVNVHSIDRLARNLVELNKIVSLIAGKGGKVSFMKEGLTFDSSAKNPLQSLLFSVLGAFSEFERELLRERQQEGILVAKKKGTYKTRGCKFSNKVKTEIAEAYKQGASVLSLIKEYSVSRQTIYNYIKTNPN